MKQWAAVTNFNRAYANDDHDVQLLASTIKQKAFSLSIICEVIALVGNRAMTDWGSLSHHELRPSVGQMLNPLTTQRCMCMYWYKVDVVWGRQFHWSRNNDVSSFSSTVDVLGAANQPVWNGSQNTFHHGKMLQVVVRLQWNTRHRFNTLNHSTSTIPDRNTNSVVSTLYKEKNNNKHICKAP